MHNNRSIIYVLLIKIIFTCSLVLMINLYSAMNKLYKLKYIYNYSRKRITIFTQINYMCTFTRNYM